MESRVGDVTGPDAGGGTPPASANRRASNAVEAPPSGDLTAQDSEPRRAQPGRSRRFISDNRTDLQLLAGVVLLMLLFSALQPNTFPTSGNLVNVLTAGSVLLVAAVSQSLTIIVGGFDLSVGANMGFTSVVAALLLSDGLPLGIAVVIAILSGLAVGVVNGYFIAYLKINPFVVTLATWTFLSGFGNTLSGGASVGGAPRSIKYLGSVSFGPIPSAVVIAAVVVGVAWLILARSRVGLYIYAIGGSRETTRLSGVNNARYELGAYALCGAFGAVGGVMLLARISVGQTGLGDSYELLSIATAVIGGVAIGGGLGRLRGVVLGVALIAILTNGLQLAGADQFVQQMITGAVLVGAVLLAQARGGLGMSLRRFTRLRTPRANPS